jgi:hypothetical protein
MERIPKAVRLARGRRPALNLQARLASLCLARGNLADAEDLIRDALGRAQGRFGPESPMALRFQRYLGDVHRAQRRLGR